MSKNNNFYSADSAEEKRMRELDEIAQAVDDEQLVQEAKYGDASKGILPCSASELALKALKKKSQDIAYRTVDVGVAAAKGLTLKEDQANDIL